MSVHRLKDGRWIVAYKKDSKVVWEYFGRGLEAESSARKRNEELKLRSWTRRTPIIGPAFTELVNEYLQARSSILQSSTLENMLYKLNGIILPEIGNIPAIRIDHRQLDKYVAKRLKTAKRTTVHRELSDIHAILSWGCRRGFLSFNPAAGYEKPKRDDSVIIPPSRTEILALLRVSPLHLKQAICLSYFTGLRPGRAELFSLSWEDVDLEAGTIIIRSASKGGQKYRIVPLHRELASLLKEWQGQTNNTGTIIRYKNKKISSIKTSFKLAKKKAGITRRLTLYSLRHAFVSELLRHGADLKSVSETVGHSRPDTTLRIYQHTDSAMRRSAVDLLPSLDIDKT